MDLTSRHEIYNVADKVRKDVGVVTMLVNNAGIVSGTAFLDTPDSKAFLEFLISNFFCLSLVCSTFKSAACDNAGSIGRVLIAKKVGVRQLLCCCN